MAFYHQQGTAHDSARRRVYEWEYVGYAADAQPGWTIRELPEQRHSRANAGKRHEICRRAAWKTGNEQPLRRRSQQRQSWAGPVD